MIHANRIVTVGEQESIIDRPIILYRGDREVEIEFTLVGNEFMFSEDGNVIKSVNASHGQLVLNTPSGEHMFSELAECNEGKVVFVVTKEMIDEFVEVGFYSFQIRLYDSAEMKSRVTIPPVMNGFDIRNPIAAEDEVNVVDQGLVDYARVFKDQSNEELPTFDWTGAYNKTEWEHHDVITENKMNKIEDALYSINANVKESDVFMLNALDNVKKDADKYVKEHMAEVEADVEEFERNLNTGVERFKIDTNAAMTAHKNEVSEELESVNTQLAHAASYIGMFKDREVNILEFGCVGDGSTDCTEYIQNAVNHANSSNKIVIIPEGVFLVSKSITIPSNLTIKGLSKTKSIIICYKDIPIFTTNGGDKGYGNINISNLHFAPRSTNKTRYTLELYNTFNTCISDCFISGQVMNGCDDVEGIAFLKDSSYTGEHFVNSVRRCQLSSASVIIESTDSYIQDCEIWGNDRPYCIYLKKPSQFVINNQLVPSPINGGILIEDSLNNYDVEIIRIEGNYFDGSYSNINTGKGIIAKNLRLSNIIGNDFWKIKESGLHLENCHSLNINSNIFTDCNINNNFHDDIYAYKCVSCNFIGNTHKQSIDNTNKGSAYNFKSTPTLGFNNISNAMVYFYTLYNDSIFTDRDKTSNCIGLKQRVRKCKAVLTDNFTTKQNAEIVLPFNEQIYADDLCYLHNNSIYIQDSGLYSIEFCISTGSDSSSYNRLAIFKYINQQRCEKILDDVVNGYKAVNGSFIEYFNVNDNISLKYYTPNQINISNGINDTYIKVTKIG